MGQMGKAFKKWYFWLVLAVVIIIGGVSVHLYQRSQPVDISKYISIKSEGYNKSGTVKLTGDYQHKIAAIISDRKPKEKKKYLKAVKVTLDKKSGLSNGQTVTATVTSSLKGNPIKATTKTMTVKGLEPIPHIKNLSAVLSSIDSRVRSQFSGNSAYKWDITRLKGIYFISGTLGDTNTNTKKESLSTPVSSKAFSLIAVYHFKGIGSIDKGDNGYVISGYSNITIKDNEVEVSSVAPAKVYWHFGKGSANLTIGFLNWVRTFGTEQEVTDWMSTQYPASVKIYD